MRIRRWGLWPVVLLLGVLSAAALAEELSRSTPDHPGMPQAPLVIHLQGGRLTMRAEDVSLEAVLQEIARQGALQLVLDTPVPERVSVHLVDLPLVDGLRRLLQGYNFILVAARMPAGTHRSTPPMLTQIRVIAPSDGTTPRDPAAEVASNPGADGPGSHQQAEAAARVAAVDFVGESQCEEELAVLTAALRRDADWQVRRQAAAILGRVGKARTMDQLTQALQDPEPRVREMAVAAIAEHGGEQVIVPLQRALADDDEAVREMAAGRLLAHYRTRED